MVHLILIFICWKMNKVLFHIAFMTKLMKLMTDSLLTVTRCISFLYNFWRCYGNGFSDYRLGTALMNYEWYTNVGREDINNEKHHFTLLPTRFTEDSYLPCFRIFFFYFFLSRINGWVKVIHCGSPQSNQHPDNFQNCLSTGYTSIWRFTRETNTSPSGVNYVTSACSQSGPAEQKSSSSCFSANRCR